MAILYQNFTWHPEKPIMKKVPAAAPGGCASDGIDQEETSKSNAISYMNFCNQKNEEGWKIIGVTDMDGGHKVVHCKTCKNADF